MNTHINKNEDEQLRVLLREGCAVSPQRNPEFRSAVWRRIDARRDASDGWGAWLRMNFLRVTACATACITIAAATGGMLANNQTQRERETLIARYVASIDPLQKNHATTHAHQ